MSATFPLRSSCLWKRCIQSLADIWARVSHRGRYHVWRRGFLSRWNPALSAALNGSLLRSARLSGQTENEASDHWGSQVIRLRWVICLPAASWHEEAPQAPPCGPKRKMSPPKLNFTHFLLPPPPPPGVDGSSGYTFESTWPLWSFADGRLCCVYLPSCVNTCLCGVISPEAVTAVQSRLSPADAGCKQQLTWSRLAGLCALSVHTSEAHRLKLIFLVARIQIGVPHLPST